MLSYSMYMVEFMGHMVCSKFIRPRLVFLSLLKLLLGLNIYTCGR